MLYTSYYKHISKEEPNTIYIQISNSKPNWFHVHTYSAPILYPLWDLVEAKHSDLISEQAFIKKYYDQLNSQSDRIASFFEKVQTLNKTVVMLCHEKSDDFCHRHLLRTWLKGVGIEVEEL